MEFISRTVSVGGSLMITVPKQIADMLNLHANEQLEVEVKKAKTSAFGMFKGTKLTRFTKEDELDFNV